MAKRKMRENQKPKNSRKTIRRLLSYVKKYWALLLVTLLCVLFSTASMIVGISLLEPVLDTFIIPFIGQQNPNLSKFIQVLVTMIVVYLIGAATSWLNNRIMLKISTSVLFKIRSELFEKLEKLPISFFDKYTHGELMSRFTNDTDASDLLYAK